MINVRRTQCDLYSLASWYNYYSDVDTIPGTDVPADKSRDIYNDIATTFILLIAIYFPSITGKSDR